MVLTLNKASLVHYISNTNDFKAFLDIWFFSPKVIATAEKHLKLLHQSSLKQLEEQHAKDCSNTYKNLEKKASEQLKSPRESGDREEINR